MINNIISTITSTFKKLSGWKVILLVAVLVAAVAFIYIKFFKKEGFAEEEEDVPDMDEDEMDDIEEFDDEDLDMDDDDEEDFAGIGDMDDEEMKNLGQL
jgi:cell division protein FtsL